MKRHCSPVIGWSAHFLCFAPLHTSHAHEAQIYSSLTGVETLWSGVENRSAGGEGVFWNCVLKWIWILCIHKHQRLLTSKGASGVNNGLHYIQKEKLILQNCAKYIWHSLETMIFRFFYIHIISTQKRMHADWLVSSRSFPLFMQRGLLIEVMKNTPENHCTSKCPTNGSSPSSNTLSMNNDSELQFVTKHCYCLLFLVAHLYISRLGKWFSKLSWISRRERSGLQSVKQEIDHLLLLVLLLTAAH